MADFQENLTLSDLPAPVKGRGTTPSIAQAPSTGATLLAGAANLLNAAAPVFEEIGNDKIKSAVVDALEPLQKAKENGVINDIQFRTQSIQAELKLKRDFDTDIDKVSAYTRAYLGHSPVAVQNEQDAKETNVAQSRGALIAPNATAERQFDLGSQSLSAEFKAQQSAARMEALKNQTGLDQTQQLNIAGDSMNDLHTQLLIPLQADLDAMIEAAQINSMGNEEQILALRPAYNRVKQAFFRQTDASWANANLPRAVIDKLRDDRDKLFKGWDSAFDEKEGGIGIKRYADMMDVFTKRYGMKAAQAAPIITGMKELLGTHAFSFLFQSAAVNAAPTIVGEFEKAVGALSGEEKTRGQELLELVKTHVDPAGELERYSGEDNLKKRSEALSNAVGMMDSYARGDLTNVATADNMHRSLYTASIITNRYATTRENLGKMTHGMNHQRVVPLLEALKGHKQETAAATGRSLVIGNIRTVRENIKEFRSSPENGGHYSPTTGRFEIDDPTGGKPSVAFSSSSLRFFEERAREVDTVNQALDNIVAFSKYDPDMSKLSDLEIRNFVAQTVFGIENIGGTLLKKGESFPKVEGGESKGIQTLAALGNRSPNSAPEPTPFIRDMSRRIDTFRGRLSDTRQTLDKLRTRRLRASKDPSTGKTVITVIEGD